MEETEIRKLFDKLIAPFAEKIKTLEEKAEDVRVWQAKYGTYIDEIRDTVKGLADKPQKRWDTLIAAFIAAAVSAAVSVLVR